MKTQSDKIIILDKILLNGRLNSYYATYEMGIKQAPARVHYLNKDIQNGLHPSLKGKKIISVPPLKPYGKSDVDWVLEDDLPTQKTPVKTQPEATNKPIRYEFIGNRAIPIYG